jgi:hypothetical protein
MSVTDISLQNPNTFNSNESKPTELFFDSVLKKVEEASIRTGTRKEAKELIQMIAEMRYNTERTAIIL